MDDADDNGDVDDDATKYSDDAAEFVGATAPGVDRPFGGMAPTGGMRPTRGRLTARTTERECPFKKEASSAQGVSGGYAHARDWLASGGVAAEEKPQGKTGQGVSSADFFVANKRQSEKEAGSAHGVTMAAGARQQAKDRARRSPTKRCGTVHPQTTAGPTRRDPPERGLTGRTGALSTRTGPSRFPTAWPTSGRP